MQAFDLFDLNHTKAGILFDGKSYPWEVLSLIKSYIVELGKTLSLDEYNQIGDDVWIAKSATVHPSANVIGPCIVGERSELRPSSYVRGSVLIGDDCVIGNSTELKNCIIFDSVQVPHFNYVGDSILGYRSHLGAGAVTSNVKSDKTTVCVNLSNGSAHTGLKKLGAMVGDYVEVGCNSVLCPGTVIGRRTIIYPLSRVRGFVTENSIFKNENNIIKRQ